MNIQDHNIRLAFLINSFNRKDIFEEALAAIDSWLPDDADWKDSTAVVVYDAGSTDGTVEWLEKRKASSPYPIEIILPAGPEEDTSFAAGLNTIGDYSVGRYPALEYLLFYETDNQILSGEPVSRARDLLKKHDDMAACGFTVRRVDGEPAGIGNTFPTVKDFLLGPKVIHHLRLRPASYNRPEHYTDRDFIYMDIVHTSPLLVKVEAWKDSGGLDAENFPFSDCDLDWAKTLNNKGWTMAVIPTDQAIHDNQAALSTWSNNRAVQFHQGRYRYLRKHAGDRLRWIWPAGLMVRHGLEWVAANVVYAKDEVRRKRIRTTAGRLFKLCRHGYDRTKEKA